MVWVLGALTSLLLLTTPPTAIPDDPSFVHTFSDGVWFLQWTDRDGTLAGQSQNVFVRADLTLQSNSQALSGTRSGADVTLTVGGTFAGAPLGTVFTGRLRGSTLVLNIPLQNGSMEAVVFQSGTVKDYNRAVATLRLRVDRAIQERKRAADLAARQRAVALANERLRDLLFDIQTATNDLRRNLNFTPVLDLLAQDWARMQRDYATLRADAAKQPLTCVQFQVTVKNDLEITLANDLQVHLGNDNEVDFASSRREVTDRITQLTKRIQETQRAFAALQAAVRQNTLGTPGPAFTEAQVNAVIATGYQQIRDANAIVSAAEAQKDHILADAQALYKRAKDFVASLTCNE